jgi:hypothetical protein
MLQLLKNVASQVISFHLEWVDGQPYTGAAGTVTVYHVGDGGTEDAAAGTLTKEASDVGTYSFVPDQAETNFNQIKWTAVGPSGVVASVVQATTDQSYERLGAPAGASVSADIAAIEAQTDDIGAAGAGLTAVPWNAAWDAEVQSEVQDALDATLADSVPADGSRPSLAQAAYMIVQFLTERSVSGTTVTVKKVDGSTALLTLTLNDATSPTSITRS